MEIVKTKHEYFGWFFKVTEAIPKGITISTVVMRKSKGGHHSIMKLVFISNVL